MIATNRAADTVILLIVLLLVWPALPPVGRAGRAFALVCDATRPAGLPEVGANAAPIAMADQSHGAFPGNVAGGSRGAADRVRLDAARGAARRDVRRQAWIGVFDHQCHAALAG